MGLLNTLGSFFGLNTLSIVDGTPTLEQQVARAARSATNSRPWRPATVDEALGVPAIFRAVSLIANTTGRLAMEGWRNNVRMSAVDTPQLLRRPDPLRTPRAFYRDSGYYLASRGEVWWWVAKRDGDGQALSLVVVPPYEVTVQPTADRFRPDIWWLGRKWPREDMRQLTFLPDASGYRGIGPLQKCGAAISVAVEAQEWAANFYASGGHPSGVLHSDMGLSSDEADTLREKWTATPSNMPQVTSGDLTYTEMQADVAAGQMLEARDYQNGDACRLFGIPGALMEFAQSGTSLTYQNVSDVWRQFQEGCLTPGYLEPIEQEMSDLLARSTISRFNIEALLRADIKTRYDVYGMAIPLGVLTVEEARQKEGMAPGDIEFATIPFSPPQANPPPMPLLSRSAEWRCSGCRRKIAEAQGRGARIRCRCGVLNESVA